MKLKLIYFLAFSFLFSFSILSNSCNEDDIGRVEVCNNGIDDDLDGLIDLDDDDCTETGDECSNNVDDDADGLRDCDDPDCSGFAGC